MLLTLKSTVTWHTKIVYFLISSNRTVLLDMNSFIDSNIIIENQQLIKVHRWQHKTAGFIATIKKILYLSVL